MVSDRIRNEVWTGLWNIERTCRYYEEVHARATFWTITLRVLILLAVASGVTAIMDLLPLSDAVDQWMKAAVAFAITGLTIGDVVTNFPKKAAIAQVIYTQCTKLRVEWIEIWLSVDDESTDEAGLRRRILRLERELQEIEGLAGFSDIKPDRKLNEKTTKDAHEVTAWKYNA